MAEVNHLACALLKCWSHDVEKLRDIKAVSYLLLQLFAVDNAVFTHVYFVLRVIF